MAVNKYSGLAQTFDTSQIVQQAVQSTNLLAQQQAQISQQQAQQKADAMKSLSDQASQFALKDAEQRIQIKKEKDAAIKSLLDEVGAVDMSGILPGHNEDIMKEYKELEEFVAQNVNEIYNPADNAAKYTEFKRMKGHLIKNISKSKSLVATIAKQTEELASNELYQNRWRPNEQQIRALTTLDLDDPNYSTLSTAPLKAGIDSDEYMRGIGTKIQPQGGSYSIESKGGKELLVVKDNVLDYKQLVNFYESELSSNKGRLAVAERYDIDNYDALNDKQKRAIAEDFANQTQKYLENDIKVTNVTASDSGGGGSTTSEAAVDLVPYAIGQNTFAAFGDASADMVAVPLSNGTALFDRVVEKKEGEAGTTERLMYMGSVLEDENMGRSFSVADIDILELPPEIREAFGGNIDNRANNTYTQILDKINEQSGKTAADKVSLEALKKKYGVGNIADVAQAQFNEMFKGGPPREWLSQINAKEFSDKSADIITSVDGTDVGTKMSDVNESIKNVISSASTKGDKKTITFGVGDNAYSITIEAMSGNAFEVKSGDGTLLDKNATLGKSAEDISNMIYNKIQRDLRLRASYSTKYSFGFDNSGQADPQGGGAPFD